VAAPRAVEVYLEMGAKRVFAGAVDWPGWSRSGKTEDVALETLAAYGARYADAVRAGGLRPPARGSDLMVVERLKGDATTDFGAPGAAPDADRRPVSAADLTHLRKYLDSAWAAFDRAARDARGSELATGPRGGGRQLDAIVEHVVGAEGGYLRRIAARPPDIADPESAVGRTRGAVREAVERAVIDGLPASGPRGGLIWTVRYFVRRTAWHALDHAWEIEDRSAATGRT
jgi:hypothetical protein